MHVVVSGFTYNSGGSADDSVDRRAFARSCQVITPSDTRKGGRGADVDMTTEDG